jgi:anaerobic magnesium-protoporphyrin IX monomethyl ester cyclase
MKVLFVRPPRLIWPLNSETSAFWQPLGFASMAAVLREHNFNVEILDCCIEKIGWKTLEIKLRNIKADIVCVGDEAASHFESIKVVNICKLINNTTVCVAGGYFFGNMINEIMSSTKIDYIIKGEGEITLLELVGAINKKTKPTNIKGLAYKTSSNKIIINKERELIKNLDDLPFPAYDLLKMELYGTNSINHPDFIALEHGRGCSGGCKFCSIWNQMSNKGCIYYRTKSAKRCFEETKYFVDKYSRKTINWVDGTFNLDPKWSKEYFNLLELNKIKVNHTAWMRSDCIVRDEKNGLLNKMVNNGLIQAVIGMERCDDESMKKLNKKNNSVKTNKEAFKLLKTKYPSVYTIATLVYGMPEDSWKELKNIDKIQHSNMADIVFPLPFTPFPGTELWEEYKQIFNLNDLKKFNLHFPVLPTKYLTKKQLNLWFKTRPIDFFLINPSTFMRGVFFEKDLRKRKINRSLSIKMLKIVTQAIINKLTFKKGYELEYGRVPKWYNS